MALHKVTQLSIFRDHPPPESVAAVADGDLSAKAGADGGLIRASVTSTEADNREATPQWTWPDCTKSCGRKSCGYVEGGPPTHCRQYQPIEGTRADVAQGLNAYLKQNGHKGRVSA